MLFKGNTGIVMMRGTIDHYEIGFRMVAEKEADA